MKNESTLRQGEDKPRPYHATDRLARLVHCRGDAGGCPAGIAILIALLALERICWIQWGDGEWLGGPLRSPVVHFFPLFLVALRLLDSLIYSPHKVKGDRYFALEVVPGCQVCYDYPALTA